jgi:hypothetical protein
MSEGWGFALVGVPWWLVLPFGGALAWLLGWLAHGEAARVRPRARRALVALRAGAALALTALLLEPTLVRESTTMELPAVAVVIDSSASMAASEPRMGATERLDEAIALGLIPRDLRPDPWRRAATELGALDADLDLLVAAAQRDDAHWRPLPGRGERPRERVVRHLEQSDALARELAGSAEFTEHFRTLHAFLTRFCDAFVTAAGTDATLAADAGALHERLRGATAQLAQAQAAADAALVAGASEGSPLARALAMLGPMTRWSRAQALIEHTLRPALAGRGAVEVVALSDAPALVEHAPPLPAAPSGSTDFSSPLASLARAWPGGGARPGAVVIVSDGRQTAGGDATGPARALAARGARVWGVCIGDPKPPRDAVVAELRGPREVFKGETVRLDARVRIVGYGDSPWDLVLLRDGVEVDRRSVRPHVGADGTPAWWTERFERADDDPGVHEWQARIERPGEAAGAVPGGGLSREVWTGLPGYSVADLLPALEKPPNEVGTAAQAATADARENYGERLRGWVVPPTSGTYVFWITADDSAELRLGLGPDARSARAIASVPEWTAPDVWDKYRSQRSPPLQLEAGKRYWIEILHKQGPGTAHLAVGWQLPDNRLERPLPAARLAPLPSGKPPPPAPDEPEASTDNNLAECTVAVVDDPLQVLLVDEEPRWDARYLASMFERDPRVHVDRRYRAVRLARGEHELLPTSQDALDAFDVVILGDLSAAELKADDQARLERFVSNRGGFLVCLSGPRGMPASYGLGPLADLLPVRVPTAATPPPQAVVLSLPSGPGAGDSPITAVLDDPALNRRLWPALPPLQWSVPGAATKPGAQALLVADDAAHTPVAAVSRYGAGRVLWLGSDETWRWRDRLGDRVHQAFWLQAVRWGLGSRLRGHDPRLQVAVDRMLLEPGEGIELLARARTSGGLLLREPPTARLARLDHNGAPVAGSEQTIELREIGDAAGLFHAGISGLGEGRWRIVVLSSHPDLSGVSESREVLVRARASQEGAELAADPAELARIADAGGGRAGSIADAADIARDAAAALRPDPAVTRVTWRLWGGWDVLVAVTVLLGVLWGWRKRVGLP